MIFDNAGPDPMSCDVKGKQGRTIIDTIIQQLFCFLIKNEGNELKVSILQLSPV